VATALGTCFLTIMGITAKRKGWEIGEIAAEIDKKMTVGEPREIECIYIHIFMPSGLSIEKLKVLQRSTEDFPIIRGLKSSLKIKANWTTKTQEVSKCNLTFLPLKYFEKHRR